ncbi:uncharacterized protein LOC105183684 [Harpegnathos saltator]|uniref:uncharacterized protein LOC105183684 n=1 Tax=Harpegnathos saltator TaxID=610380 RepID=UPI00058D2CF1|nr:uncharacterized protein LOC105183684 [Harpegnathos saltator]
MHAFYFSIIQVPCSPSCLPFLPVGNDYSKYYQEIGAEMIGNQLLIRLEKDKNRLRKKRHEWNPPCDCVEIQRPTSKRGPKIINANYDDRVVFRVHSSSQFDTQEELAYKSQTVAYIIESCRDEQNSHRCKTITIYPQKSIPGSQEVYTNHITEENQDIFLLRIKKKMEFPDQKNRNVELELRTPKQPKLLKLPTPSFTQPVVVPLQPENIADLVVEDIKEPENSSKFKNKSKKKPKKAAKKRKYADVTQKIRV